MTSSGSHAIEGCLLGCAIGDAIGLPYEGISQRRIRRWARFPLRHSLLFGRGMLSDDTDHNIFVAQALIRSKGDVAAFRRSMAWRLRLWLLCFPAGIGMATLKSIVQLWLGFSKSGIYSAGNGPKMRSAVIGAVFASDASARRLHVEASTTLTHTDPKALAAALAVAEVAACLAAGSWVQRPSPRELAVVLSGVSSDPAWLAAVKLIEELCASAVALDTAPERLGSRNGVSGYALHTVPFAIVAWHRHFGDYRATIEAVVRAGGDVDTVAAIAGALAGITVGRNGIPPDWIDGVIDRPHSIAYVRALAGALADPSARVSTAFSPWQFPRGIFFLAVVLAHGFRRLAPPY